MKKKFLTVIGVFIFISMFLVNITLVSDGSNLTSSLTSIGKIALADGENAVKDCPGGSCSYTYTDSHGNPVTCKSCCPSGKSPKCDSWGCVCE